jgi:hypothetical protein
MLTCHAEAKVLKLCEALGISILRARLTGLPYTKVELQRRLILTRATKL